MLYIGWKQEVESVNVLVRDCDLTRGKPDLKSSKLFLRGDYQWNRSLEIPTPNVVSKKGILTSMLRGKYLAY